MGGLLDRLRSSGPGRFYAKYSADRADEGAILIAWQALLSIFPMLLGLLAILGLLLRDPERSQALVDTIQALFPSQVSELLSFMETTRENTGLLGLISIVTLLWSGSALFGAMATVFNRFYGGDDRGFIGQRLMAFGMMAVYVVLILVSVLSSSLSTLLIGISERVLPFRVPGSALVLGWIVSLSSAIVMFLALFRFVPNVPLTVSEVWRGAVLAGVLVVVLMQAFPLYLRWFGGSFEAYAALGLLLLLMTWFYLLARIIVLGAELNAFLSGRRVVSEEVEPVRAAARRGAGGRPPAADTPGKVLLWAGISAGITGLILAFAQRTSAAVWRAVTGEQPPVRGSR
jgi:membrane protein